MKPVVIIPAGGVGKRFGGALPKHFVELSGVPIIVRTIKAFSSVEDIDSIVISVHEDWLQFTLLIVEKYNLHKVKEIVIGGAERQDSVFNAIKAKTCQSADFILVHDAVRPFVSRDLIKNVIQATFDSGAVIPAIPVTDTVKVISAQNTVKKTLDRSRLRLVQTPQGFSYEVLSQAYENAINLKYKATDCSSIVELHGQSVHIVAGDEQNIKITTPLDMRFAELILSLTTDLE